MNLPPRRNGCASLTINNISVEILFIVSENFDDDIPQSNDVAVVSWSDNLSIGIELIDSQHKHLVALTNQLFQACTRGGDKRDTVFKNVMSQMVEYVRVHFTAEQELMHRINYPHYAEHKSEHDKLIRKVLETTNNYDKGKKFVPNDFVRFLKDWIVSHIAHTDKMIALYITAQKKKGLLSDQDIEG